MISSLEINGYRGLERLEMSDLGRVNLLVGTNNSGKTSILEAIEILASKGDPIALWQILWRRGERLFSVSPAGADPPRQVLVEGDICHLFSGHEIHPGTKFSIIAKNQSPLRAVVCEIVELSAKERAEAANSEQAGLPTSPLALKISGHPPTPVTRVSLGRLGGLAPNNIDFTHRRGTKDSESSPTQFITTESMSAEQLLTFWNKVSLKPEEELVLQALRFLDKDIERIALQSNVQQPYYFGPSVRGGFMVKLKSSQQPVPIGSMGDGMWRMLAMSIVVTLCKDGILLVDEIDTGLHYTVMSAMWKLIYNAAKQFNVQVFATSHSQDCIWSLAQLAEQADTANPITVQRIEPHRAKTVPFSGRELALAAEREIEVR